MDSNEPNRESAYFKNIKFYDTYYYKSGGKYLELPIDSNNLWIYPNQSVHSTNGEFLCKDGTNIPIVQCYEYTDEDKKVVNMVHFNNY